MAPHIHEKIDFTVEVYIVNDGAVLLRKHDKYEFWLGVGGHIETDEDPLEAAVREVKEEVGLEVELIGNPKPDVESSDVYRELVPPVYMNRHSIGGHGHEHVSLVYFARTDSRNVVHEKEGIESYWLTKEEIEENSLGLKADVRAYALEALRRLS